MDAALAESPGTHSPIRRFGRGRSSATVGLGESADVIVRRPSTRLSSDRSD
jgi:hypothetical protein